MIQRRVLLKTIASALLLPLLPRPVFANPEVRRRPGDADWPSPAAWEDLKAEVQGNLRRVDFPISLLQTDPDGTAAADLLDNLKNPYFVGDQPGLTQTSGWVDAWQSRPSVYAVEARTVADIAAAINFARHHKLRLVVKGGGHSYQGASNAPDSLLVWTRHMNRVEVHDAFVPDGCEHIAAPQPAVTLDAGALWVHAYDAVTTRGGRYVQGGGCLTVGVSGLIQSGGFGSLSKHYGLAAASLLEAEVVTADGQVRVTNPCNHPDLFWALKGGGGGTFGVVSKVTLKTHALVEYIGIVNITFKAKSAAAYQRLVREFIDFYQARLFNDRWGEQVRFGPNNSITASLLAYGLDGTAAREVWQPFLDRVDSVREYSTAGVTTFGTVPARHFWDLSWWQQHWSEVVFPTHGSRLIQLFDDVLSSLPYQPLFAIDPRSGAGWWKGDGDQTGQYLWAYESLWLPASLLDPENRQHLADALYASSRISEVALHFNKGLAGAPTEAIAAARNTATNPAVVDAFALAIAARGEGFAYPGTVDHEPSTTTAREAARQIRQCMDILRGVAGDTGAYVSESNYFEKNWQHAYWGSNYPRLAEIKQKYDPDGLFVVHNGVGSEAWSADGFTRRS